MKRTLIAAGLLSGVLLAACSSSSPDGGGTAGSSSLSEGGGAGSSPVGASGTGGAASTNLAQYNTLTGTFVAPNINVAFTGAMVGTYSDPVTNWNAMASFDVAANGGVPTFLAPVTGTPEFPGDTGNVLINITGIQSMPVAGTYPCSGSGSDAATINLAYQEFPAGGTKAVQQYTQATSCTFTVDAPTVVNEPSDEGDFTVYFAHGSLTAVLGEEEIGGDSDGTTGTLTVSW